MAEPISVVKLVDVSPTALVKSTSSTLKGLLVIGLVALGGWLIYVGVVKPNVNPIPTTRQSGTITNNYINPTADQLVDIINKQVKKQQKKFFLGVRVLGFDIGISK